MFVWGGVQQDTVFFQNPTVVFDDGAVFDTAAGRWVQVAAAPFDSSLYEPTAVWDGTEVIVVGLRCSLPFGGVEGSSARLPEPCGGLPDRTCCCGLGSVRQHLEDPARTAVRSAGVAGRDRWCSHLHRPASTRWGGIRFTGGTGGPLGQCERDLVTAVRWLCSRSR